MLQPSAARGVDARPPLVLVVLVLVLVVVVDPLLGFRGRGPFAALTEDEDDPVRDFPLDLRVVDRIFRILLEFGSPLEPVIPSILLILSSHHLVLSP
jgi:hypothetical protein